MSTSNDDFIINSASLGFRDKNEDPKGHHSWIEIGDDNIPYDEPCVFILGGSGTINNKSVNGYAKVLSESFANEFLQNVKIHGAVYNFTETYNPESDVKKSMITNGRNLISDKGFLWYLIDKETQQSKQSQIKKIISSIFFNKKKAKHANETKNNEEQMQENTNKKPNSQLIEKIFNQLLLPRISEKNTKLDINEALKRIRNVTFVIHCYGGHIFLSLEKLMQKKMEELGYTLEEQKQIQKQLFSIALAPMYPLGKSKSTMLSFVSAQDKFFIYMHNNIFSLYINAIRKYILNKEKQHGMLGRKANKKDFSILANPENNFISYFPDERGNVIIFPHIGDKNTIDQETEHLLISKEPKLGPNGKVFEMFVTNAITNSIKSALTGNLLPDIKELITHNEKTTRKEEEILENIFEIAEKNGTEIYNKMKTLKIRQVSKDIKNKTHRYNTVDAIKESVKSFTNN